MTNLSFEQERASLQRRLADTESALQRAESLALAGRFAASVMHEINGPLEAVTNFAFLMHTEKLTDTAALYLTMMEEQLGRLGEIARQTLVFYQPSQHRQTANLVHLIHVALRIYEQPLNAKQMVLELDLPPYAVHEVFPAELTQAVSNLISNAIDASGHGGKLCIRLRSHSRRADITIGDQGAGVPRHVRESLFEAFSTGKSAGHGLGLWICRKAVDKHGGKILWRSSTNPERSGTVFRLSFPGAPIKNADTRPSRQMGLAS